MSKIGLRYIFGTLLDSYRNEKGRLLPSDCLIFIALPLVATITSYLFGDISEVQRPLLSAVALLSGFLFAAMTLILNAAGRSKYGRESRKSKAFSKTLLEISIISAASFATGAIILILGFIQIIIPQVTETLSILADGLVSVQLGLFLFLTLNTLMLSKKSLSVVSDILSKPS